ncbi:MAG: biotin/lipoyl-containing protein, partial [Flavobacteriaceae bacterium]|nr:biotin/lipoyl-containing protein [Flavobacteriaceae bacterium]
MAEVINMPRLSDTMEEGTVASWLKKVGDKIEEGDILAEIETDKATMEFESFYEGTLLHIGVQEGETTKVDELLAIIGEEGEDISDLINGAGKESTGKKSSDSKEDKKDSKSEDKPKEEKSKKSESEESEATGETEIPEGVTVVTMPRLSDTMEEGTVATWLKKVGDKVEEGDILVEIETDKATMEFESFNSGTLLHIGLEEGDSAKVDSLLAILGPEGTDVSDLAKNYSTLASSTSEEKTTKSEEKQKEKPAESKESKPDSSTKETEKPSTVQPSSGDRIFASPLAKKIAEERGFQLNQIKGTGENGRIVKRDIESFQPGQVPASVGKFVPTGQEDYDEKPNSQMRKVIAKRLAESKFTSPHYYLNVEMDMDNAISFREQYNSKPDT